MNKIVKFVGAGIIVSGVFTAMLTKSKPAVASSGPAACTVQNVWFQQDLMEIVCAQPSTGPFWAGTNPGAGFTNNSCGTDIDTVKSLLSIALTAQLTAQTLTVYYTNESCFTSGNADILFGIQN
jgi:hypothetical protein